MSNLSAFGKFLSVTLLTGLLAACVKPNVPLQQGAQNVKFSDARLPQSCKRLGEVGVENENGRADSYISHAELQQLDLKRMRNQALHMGANVIVMTEHRTVYRNQSVYPERFRGESKLNILSWHIMKGNAYVCPPSVWQGIPFTLPPLDA